MQRSGGGVCTALRVQATTTKTRTRPRHDDSKASGRLPIELGLQRAEPGKRFLLLCKPHRLHRWSCKSDVQLWGDLRSGEGACLERPMVGRCGFVKWTLMKHEWLFFFSLLRCSRLMNQTDSSKKTEQPKGALGKRARDWIDWVIAWRIDGVRWRRNFK